MKCVFCNKTLHGCGCDAMPVARGRCCARCDDLIVTPFRMAQATGLPLKHLMKVAKTMHVLAETFKLQHQPPNPNNGAGHH